MMVDTDHSRDLPCAIFVPPDMDELRLADNAMVLFPRVKESMNSDLNCSIALQAINFEGFGYQLPLHLSTKIVLDGIDDLRTAHHQAVLVVVELRIFGPERHLSLHVTAVDCIEKLLIEL